MSQPRSRPAGTAMSPVLSFADRQLVRRGVPMLDDGAHFAARVAQHAAVAPGFVEVDGQQREALAVRGRDQLAQGVRRMSGTSPYSTRTR